MHSNGHISYQIANFRLKLSLLPICVGVTLATVSDLEMNIWGTIFAILGIGTTSMYQIYVKSKQQDLGLNSYQLLHLQVDLLFMILVPQSFTHCLVLSCLPF